ncbi:MAG: ADP-ribosylglycohydrolase family protein [Chitinophagales bacterium]|nr:ADP-ribosylglycohydrolase family protein [Chitinophagales bacterium]
MKGAIIGDIIGSRFEWANVKSKEFELFTKDSRFTDDSVLTLAIANAILEKSSYESNVKAFARNYPFAGYGGNFRKWMVDLIKGPYNSWGNGSAMRVSPIAYAFDSEEEVLAEAEKSASITHNHPEGIKGAQAIALATYLARNGETKESIKKAVSARFSYDLDRTIAAIRPDYKFDVSCQGSVPEAIIAFLESTNFEDAIRTAISIGGDSDTIACMTGAIAEAYYGGVPEEIEKEAIKRLSDELKNVYTAFNNKL